MARDRKRVVTIFTTYIHLTRRKRYGECDSPLPFSDWGMLLRGIRILDSFVDA